MYIYSVKIYVSPDLSFVWHTYYLPLRFSALTWFSFCLRHYSIYLVHDEVKDRHFELELSWVCKESGGRHQRVPKDLYEEAERYAKAALVEDSSDEDEEM